jgi:ferritin-like protein
MIFLGYYNNSSKHNELRYQVKKHEIVNKLVKETTCNLTPQFYFIFNEKHNILLEEKTKKHKEV